LAETARDEAQSVICAHGLTDTAVPVRLGDKLIGFLQTGQIFRKKPTEAQFERSAKLSAEWGVPAEQEQLREAYFGTKVVGTPQHNSVVKLLSIFAEHLAMVSNRIFVEQQNSELPVITRAKEYIQQNQTEDISLGQVAKAVHTSTFYFCKLFKKATGVNFTEYVSRVRIEKAKNLLLNPNLRVSEIAYEVGFQSLTHFNRVFKKLIGQSPTEYRTQVKAV
jgi:YesN/AraC family two-component response regulator